MSNATRLWICTSLAVLLSLASSGAFSHAQSPAPAPREQLQQYVTQLQANPSDDALRTKIIHLALTLDPKPADPPDIAETIGAAWYAFKNAKSTTDLQNSAELYAKAALEAPWRADFYFNEGVALEKAKRLGDALKAYQFYLLAAPNATDGEAVREDIGALKYQISQMQNAEATEQGRRNLELEAARERQTQQEAAQKAWSGVWRINGRCWSSVHWTFEVVGSELILRTYSDRDDNCTYSPVGHVVEVHFQLNGLAATRDDGQKLQLQDSNTILDYEQWDQNHPWQTLTRVSQ